MQYVIAKTGHYGNTPSTNTGALINYDVALPAGDDLIGLPSRYLEQPYIHISQELLDVPFVNLDINA